MVQRLNPSESGVLLLEGHVEDFVGLRRGSGWVSEVSVVPLEGAGREPLRFGFVSGILDDDAHAVMTVVVGEIAHDPNSRMIHFNDGGDTFGGAKPKTGDADGLRQGIAVHCDDAEGVAWESEAADLAGAAVEDVEEDALALFDAYGIAVSQHAAVDGERIVANFVSVRHAQGEGRFHCGLASVFQFGYGLSGGEKVHGHVSATAQGGLELLQGEEDFAIVVAAVLFRLDVDGTDEPAVLACCEIRSRADVGVVEAKT